MGTYPEERLCEDAGQYVEARLHCVDRFVEPRCHDETHFRSHCDWVFFLLIIDKRLKASYSPEDGNETFGNCGVGNDSFTKKKR